MRSKPTAHQVPTLEWKRIGTDSPTESRWGTTDGEWIVRNKDTTVKTRFGGEWDVYRIGLDGRWSPWASTNTLKDGKRIAQTEVDKERRELERIRDEELD